MLETKFENLNLADQQLLMEAEQAMAKGYNKKTDTMVGAALRTKDNKIYQGGCIARSRTSRQSTCSERMALDIAVFDGSFDYDTLAIIGKGSKISGENVVSPCGNCRQLLIESAPELRILLSNSEKNKVIVTNIQELLPLGYLD